MAQFDFYLNRSGVRGPQGEQGEQGFSPIITVATNTLSEYILQIQTQNNTFLTANLREHKDDLGGTYIRYNRETGVMYAGDADIASQSQVGVVRFAAAADIERKASDCVVSPSDVHDMIAAVDPSGDISALKQRVSDVEEQADANTQAIFVNADAISDNKDNIDNLKDTVLALSQNKADRTDIPTVGSGVITINQGGVQKGQFNLNQSENLTINLDQGGSTYTNGNGINIANGVISVDSAVVALKSDLPNMNNYYNTTQIDLMLNEKADISDIPTVGNGTITFTQGGVTKGTITTNQSGNTTIDFDAGGGSQYTLPPATTSTLGGVIPDGSTITVDVDGTIHSVGGGSTPSNMVTTDTAQTIIGNKTFRGILLTTDSYSFLGVYNSQTDSYVTLLNTDGSYGLNINPGGIGPVDVYGTAFNVHRSGQAYTNIDSGNIGTYALTGSNISTNTYIQALEARIAALEANINGGNA